MAIFNSYVSLPEGRRRLTTLRTQQNWGRNFKYRWAVHGYVDRVQIPGGKGDSSDQGYTWVAVGSGES